MRRALASLLDVVARYASLAIVLVAWEIVARSSIVPRRIFPDVGDMAAALVPFARSGDLAYHLAATLQRTALGFGAAIVAGILLGSLFARVPWFERLVEPTFLVGYPVPKIALYPLFIFVFGINDLSKIALIFLECLYPITLQTLVGLRATDRSLLWAARGFGASRAALFWNVLIPSALPAIFSGIRIALPIAFVITIVTEIIGGNRGLGYVVTFASQSFDYATAMAAVVVIGVVGFTFDRLVVGLRGRLIFWQRDLPPIG